MSTFGERLRLAREDAKLNKSQLAEKVGVTKQSVGSLENGKAKAPTPDNMFKYAKALGVNAHWLTTGEGESHLNDGDNVLLIPQKQRGVPLISWVQAGSWMEADDPFMPGDAEEWMPCPARHGENTYALRVRGDSMASPHGRTYPEGTIIYVDPDQNDITTGDRVIAKIKGGAKVTFKVFVDDGGKKFLKPLNPQHPIIEDRFRIIGKIIGSYMPE